MATRIIRSKDDIEALSGFIASQDDYPMTITITKGDNRSKRQNRLAQKWFSDIARHVEDQTREDVRAYCKMRFGVPILRAENEAFRQKYDKVFGNMAYEETLEAIQVFDLPVTRLMTVKQMTAFMDEMQIQWSRLGVRLTDPESMKYEEEFSK